MALNQTVPLDSRVVVFGPRYQNPCKVPFLDPTVTHCPLIYPDGPFPTLHYLSKTYRSKAKPPPL